MTAEFPRVAVVSVNPMRDDISNGIMMRSLFAGWPGDRLTHVYLPVSRGVSSQPDVCRDNRHIGPTGRVLRSTGDASHSASRPVDPSRRRWVRALAAVVGQGLLKTGRELWYAHGIIGSVLRRELQTVRPDIVYLLAGNYCLTRITTLACQQLGLPMYLHVTDDYVTSLYQTLPGQRRLKRQSTYWFQQAVDFSTGRAGVGPTMAHDYAARYGGSWNWFTTAVDADDYDPEPRAPDQVIRFLYAGGLRLGRWQTLAKLGRALGEWNRLAPDKLRAELAIHAPAEQWRQCKAAFAEVDAVRNAGWIEAAHLPRALHDADVLIHAESFEPVHANYTRLSVSTKLGQYLMAGRPILAVGPGDQGSIETVKASRAGLVVGSPESAELAAAVDALATNPVLRRACGEGGRRWALANMERSAMQARFIAALRAAAAATPTRLAA